MLLVMSNSGYLVPPQQDPTHEKLWVETWKRLDRFLPDLRKELDLDVKEEPVAVAEDGVVAPVPVDV
jgi:brefeldin A-resistance guanine nucleotide exchange factor 1